MRTQKYWRKRREAHAVYEMAYCKACARAARAVAAKTTANVEVPRAIYREIAAYAMANGKTLKAAVAEILVVGLVRASEVLLDEGDQLVSPGPPPGQEILGLRKLPPRLR